MHLDGKLIMSMNLPWRMLLCVMLIGGFMASNGGATFWERVDLKMGAAQHLMGCL